MMNSKEWPSFYQLTEYESPHVHYFNGWDSDCLTPAFHWCYLAEITEPRYHPFRTSVIVKDNVGTEHPIIFYYYDEIPGFRNPFAPKFKVGHTIAILYAERKTFMDLSEGIRQESEEFKVFPCSLEKLLFEIKNVSLKDSCYSCGKKDLKLSVCGNCKLSSYCGKDCQKRHWNFVHRDLCQYMKLLDTLVVLMKKPFQSHYSFSTIMWIE